MVMHDKAAQVTHGLTMTRVASEQGQHLLGWTIQVEYLVTLADYPTILLLLRIQICS